ncbi:MAG: YMGG-like glycine zipper-containing protein, partial [Thermodesulfobacteriota bacterium]|nr:YMGG-like glycine zipper-containing protein [Thermodesulfobacteriota bacterium]
MKTLSAFLCLVLLLAFSACATMEKRKDCVKTGAAIGILIGAGGGAVIGNQGDTDNTSEGAVIGAAVGGIVGGAIGCFTCKAEGDKDGDGISDNADKCPGTPTSVTVDSDGCPLDSDGDGIPDHQ